MNSSAVQIRTQINPGDIGEVIRLHGALYAQEYGWDYTFEGYVAASFGEFVLAADTNMSRLWVLEKNGSIGGAIGIVGRNNSDDAQLRWFLLAPELRGLGYGRQLMLAALQFCTEHRFESVFLWTVSELTAAARLYRAFGFSPAEEKTHPLWGKMITEVKYSLTL